MDFSNKPIKIDKNMNQLKISSGVLISALSSSFVAKFVLFFALVLIFTVLFGKFCKKFLDIPVIAGQIIAGIILGPSLLNIANWPIFSSRFLLHDALCGQNIEIISSDLFLFIILLFSAAFTVPFLMWLAGYETDIHEMLKIGPTAVLSGTLGALVPILFTVISSYFLFYSGFSLISSIGLGLIFSATSVSIPVAMLVANNKMGLRSSKATLGAAIVDDIIAVILLSLFFVFVKSGSLGPCNLIEGDLHNVSVVQMLLRIVISFVFFFGFGLTFIPVFMRYLDRNRFVTLIAPFAFFFMLLYFSFAEIVGGLAGITGAYFAGLFQRPNDEHHYSVNTVAPFINTIFVPIFLASIGLQVNIKILSGSDWVVVAALCLVAVFSKFIGIYIATRICNVTFDKRKKWTNFETYLFGASMVARGEMGLVISTLLRNFGLISDHLYVIAIVVITLTTLIAPILLAIGFSYDAKHQRGRPAIYKEIHLGHFDSVGTQNVFDSILKILEEHHMFGTIVMLSEGRYAVNFDSSKIEVIYSPETGISLIGQEGALRKLIQVVKSDISKDLLRLNYKD